ncbi:hypothetical protein SAMN05421684_1928 [Asanoa ishikariensis]|uniref:Uncharacterized protein n=1 Tax=Asanoa ishikariensis TaxID=137265 RepID=A0A1H3NA79_9ACTN|nr:hypothetical protein SAMN05421684_1928 [Asanoa ishikariensis]
MSEFHNGAISRLHSVNRSKRPAVNVEHDQRRDQQTPPAMHAQKLRFTGVRRPDGEPFGNAPRIVTSAAEARDHVFRDGRVHHKSRSPSDGVGHVDDGESGRHGAAVREQSSTRDHPGRSRQAEQIGSPVGGRYRCGPQQRYASRVLASEQPQDPRRCRHSFGVRAPQNNPAPALLSFEPAFESEEFQCPHHGRARGAELADEVGLTREQRADRVAAGDDPVLDRAGDQRVLRCRFQCHHTPPSRRVVSPSAST